MEEETIVNEEEVITPQEPSEEVIEEEPQPGAKTDSVLLLKELKEERERRRIAEAALLEKTNTPELPEVFSEEGKVLSEEIKRLERLVQKSEEDKRLENLQRLYPALEDKSDEFTDFRTNPENAGMSLEAAAKVFLTENNLLTKPKPRKGLEKETGGGRVPSKSGLSAEEIDELRTNNYPEYVKRIRAGTLLP